MIRIWLLVFFLFSAGQQMVADRYRSNSAAMNWSDTTKWDVSTDGGASWNIASSYPAQLTTDSVSILTGHIVTLDTSLAFSVDSLEIIGTLRIGNNTSVRSLSVHHVYNSGTFAAGNNTASHSLTITGNWTNNGTWTAVSGTGLIQVVIAGTGNSSLSGNAVTQTFNTFSINKNSSSDTVSIGGTTTALVFSGTVTLTSGVFIAPSVITLNTAHWTNNGGTFLPASGTVQFTGTGATPQVINGTAASQSFHRLVISKVNRTLNTGGSLTILNIDSSIVISSGTFAPVGAVTINIKGDWTNNGGTYTPGTSTIAFIKTNGPQSINGTAVSQSLGNVIINKSSDSLFVSGSTTTVSLSAFTLTSGIFVAPVTLNVSGMWTMNGGDVVEGAGTVVFNSTTAAQQITGSVALQTFNNLTVSKSGQILTLSGSMDSLVVTGNLTITAGTLADGGKQIVGDVSKNLSMSASTGLILGNVSSATQFPKNFVSANVSLNATSTVTYNANGSQTISSVPSSYGNVTLTSTALVTKSLSDSILINGNLTINLNNTLQANNYKIRIKGNWTNSAGANGFTAGTDTVVFFASGVQSIAGITQFSNILIGSTTTFRLSASADVRYNGSVINNGIFDANTNSSTVTINGPGTLPANTRSYQHLTIGTGANITAPDTLFLKGNWTNNGGTFDPDTGIVIFLSTTAAQSILGTAPRQTFYKIIVQKSAQSLTTGGSLSALYILGDLLQTTGGFIPATGDSIILAGNWMINSGSFTAGSSVVKFNNTSADQTFFANITRQIFNTLIVEKGGSQFSFGGSIDTLTVGSVLLTSGTFVAPAQITSSGHWTNNGGTFAPGSGTVSFTNTASTQTIGGLASSQTFNTIVMAKSSRTLNTAGSLSSLNINGHLILSSGVFAPANVLHINILGNWTNNGATFTPASSIVNFLNTSAEQTIQGTAAAQTFNVVTMTKSSQMLSVGGSTVTLNLDSLTLNSGSFTAPAVINMTGTFNTNGGLFVHNNGTVVFNSASIAQYINGTSQNLTFKNITVSKAAGILFALGGNLDSVNIEGKFLVTAGTVADSGVQINGNGTDSISLYNATALVLGSSVRSTSFPKYVSNDKVSIGSTNTVTYRSALAQSVLGGISYGNLILSSAFGTPVKTLTDSLLLNGSLTIASGNSFDANNKNIYAKVNWTNNGGTFIPGTSALILNGTAAQTINGTAAAQTFNQLMINKSSGTVTVSGSTATLSVNNVELIAGNFTSPATFNINGSLTQNAGVLTAGTNTNISGDWIRNGGTFTPGSGTVTFNSTSADQQVTGSVHPQLFNNLTVNKTGRQLTFGESVDSISAAVLTISNGTLIAPPRIRLTSSFVCAAAGTFSHNDGTIYFQPAANSTIGSASSLTFNNIVFDSTSATPRTISMSTTSTLNILGTLRHKFHTFTAPATLNLFGDLIQSNGTFTAGTNFNLSGNITRTGGTFTAGANTITFNNASLQQVVSSSVSPFVFGNIVVNKASDSVTFSGAVDSISVNNFTLTNGAFSAPSKTRVTGNWTVASGTNFISNGGTVYFSPAASITIGGSAPSQLFHHVRLIGSGTVRTVSYSGALSALNITGTFYQNYHTFTAPVTPNTISIGGDFTRDGGTFTANGSNLIFNNTTLPQFINGTVTTNTFNLLTVSDTLQTVTVGGSITSLTLDSLILSAGTFDPGTAATITLTGSWLNHSDADAFTSGSEIVNFTGSGAKVVGGTFPTTFNDLRSNTVNGVSLQQPITVSTLRIGNVTANSVFSDSGYQITSSGSLLLTSGIFRVGSSVNATSFPAFTTVTLSPGTTIDFASGNEQQLPVSFPYPHLILSNGGTKIPASGTLTITGNLTANSPVDLSSNNTAIALTGNISGTGAILQGSGSLSLAGNWTNTGNFSAGSGGVVYNGAAAQSVSCIPQYQDLTFSGAGTKTIAAGTLTINGHLTVGSTTALGNNPVFIGGNLIGAGAISQGTALFTLGGNWNHTGTFTVGTGGIRYNGAASQIVRSNFNYQNLTMSGAGTKVVNSGTLTITGSWYVNAPVDLSVNNPAVSVTGSVDSAGTITMGSGNVTIGGNWLNTGGTTGGTGTVILSAASPSIAGAAFGKIRLNGTGYPTLLTNVTVNDSLNLVAARLRTNENILSVSSAGTVARTTGYVFGNLQHHIPAGSPTSFYHVGDSLNYTPVTAAFNSVSVPGTVLTKSIKLNHPNITSSGLDTAKNVNRYYTMANNGTVFADVSPTFQFVAGDKDGLSNANNYIVRRYNSGTWSPTTAGTRTATSTQASAVTALGDFAVGEPLVLTITSSSHGGGSISPNGSTAVNDGDDQSFTITPSIGFHIDSVLVDGVNAGPISSYEFSSVTSSHTIDAYFSIDQLSVTAALHGNGTITPAGSISIGYGHDTTVVFSAGTGYHIDSVVVNGSVVDSASQYTFVNVTAANTINVYSSPDHHTITVSASNGSITPAGVIDILYGRDTTVTFSPNSGYHFDSLVVDGTRIFDSTASYSFLNITGDHVLQVYHSINHYTVTASAMHGSISPNGTSDVSHGEDLRLFYAPSPGYHFDSLSVDGIIRTDSTSSFTFTGINSNRSIVVYHSLNTYQITTASVNGVISPAGSVNLFHGADTTVSFSANAGYHFDSLVVDGTRVDSLSTYTFIGVTAPHSITAYHSVNHYTVTASAVNGSITPNGSTDLPYGASQQFTFSPNSGYHLDSVIVDGVPVDSTLSYTVNSVASHHTISVYYSIDHFTVTASAVNGTIVPAGAVDVPYGQSGTFTFSPDAGHHVDSVRVDGILVDSSSSYTFLSVVSNHTIEVFCSIDHFTITAAADHGSILPNGSAIIPFGGTQRFSYIPDTGYHFDSLVVDGMKVNDSTSSYSFMTVTSDHVVHAYFSINTYSIIAAVGPHGTVIPNDTIIIAHGRDTTITFSADASYHVDTVAVNGVRVDSLIQYTFLHVESDKTVSVAFASNPLHHFTVERAGGGVIEEQTAGSSFAVEVKARDVDGNILDAFSGRVVLSSIPAGAVFAGGDTSTLFDHGVLASQYITITTADSFRVNVKRDPSGPETGLSNKFSVHHAAAHHLEFSMVTGTMNDLPLDPFTVTVKDTFNNIAKNYSGTISLSKGTGFNTGDTLIGSISKSVTNGIASFSVAGIDTVMISQPSPLGGSFTILAASGSLSQVQSGSIDLGVLPVVLSSFTAEGSQRTVLLKWTTESESNSAGFVVERSSIREKDEVQMWEKAGYIEGAGNSEVQQAYSFTDEHLRAGKYSYRLRQIDRDGKFIVTAAIETEVGIAPKVFTLAQNYPNPFNPATTIEFTLPQNGRAVVKVHNSIGQEIATIFDQNAEAGRIISVPFNGNTLASGVYFYSISFNGQRIVKKMMLMK